MELKVNDSENNRLNNHNNRITKINEIPLSRVVNSKPDLNKYRPSKTKVLEEKDADDNEDYKEKEKEAIYDA